MNFYAASNMPVYRAERDTRQKDSKSAFRQVSKKSKILGLQTRQRDTVPPPARPVTSSDAVPYDTRSIEQFFDPAVDGPPSPESLRELGQQMKRASVRDKHQSHQTSSSGSSSLRSLTSADRPSWENAPDGRTLSRKSSGRSTSSSMPPRDRPESVQIFGKTIFNRRGKGRRESSAQSSSSSMYSSDVAGDAVLPPPPTSAPSRDSTIPALFGLRRSTKQDQAAEAQRRLNISGPYNFQHVAHTQKEDALESPNDTHIPGHGGPKGARGDDMHFATFSSESLALNEDDAMTAAPYELRQTTSLTRTPSVLRKHSSSRRILNRSQSQDQLSMGLPPPRPPRSPIDQSASGAPVVPPRGPSRVFGRHERFDSIDRPQTSASFRSQQQYADPGSPLATSYGYTPDMDVIHENSFAAAMSPQDDANWPLPCPSSTVSDYTLPHVPEEEEHAAHARKKSRASVTSNSSLRGSQSVPMLRGLAARQNGDSTRRTSDASDTLGRFDMLAAQQALREALDENGDALPREAWEDDIDYCYDHEAEADCDYEWSRPSLETCRDGDTATPPVDDHGRGDESCAASPAMLTPGQFDVPALSPVSQLSSATAQEVITPTVVNNHKPSNFSLPRVDSKNLLHVRKPSDASSFKESHGFTLSPSLLIPMDYQQQMSAYEAERQEASDFTRHFDEPELNMDPSALLLRYRTSASTTGTIESNSSAFDKHASTASTSTDYTRLTASVSSLEMENCLPATEPLQRFPSFESHGRTESKAAMPTLPESEEAAPPPPRRPHFKGRGSESNLGAMALDEPWAGKTKPPIPVRRGRARTTSLSTPPPANQYALFPQVQLSGNRI